MMAGGRPSKFTEQTRKKIYKYIKTGLSYKEAALAAGIGESTLRLWRARGKACSETSEIGQIEAKYRINSEVQRIEYEDFMHEIGRAEAIGEMTLAGRINKAGRGGHKYKEVRVKQREVLFKGEIIVLNETTTITREVPPTWRADAWVLERRYPERWGKQAKIYHEVKGEHDHKHEHEHDHKHVVTYNYNKMNSSEIERLERILEETATEDPNNFNLEILSEEDKEWLEEISDRLANKPDD